MSNKDQPIDITILKGLIGDDTETIKTFLIKFIQTVPENMAEIKQALAGNNFKDLKAKTHKMKSSARVIGATNMSAICQDIEDTSLDENTNELNEKIKTLVEEFNLCTDHINTNY